VGERQPAAGPAVWTVEVAGLVDRPLALTLDDLRAMPQVGRTIDIHCVTRWSKLGCRFGGVPLAAVLEFTQPRAEARFVSFLARSERGHSTSLPLDDAVQHGALLALDYDNVPLASEHGGPVRVVVPGRYFYKSLKWLARIELLADDLLGYWEAVAGYHNEADPWREQRYIAPALTRQQAAAVLARRDFRGLDLRGLDARGHDLAGLQAAGVLLRNADFRGCKLQRADFAEANLSNARLQQADLRGASLAVADVAARISAPPTFAARRCSGRRSLTKGNRWRPRSTAARNSMRAASTSSRRCKPSSCGAP
jgi:hypothetical protein